MAVPTPVKGKLFPFAHINGLNMFTHIMWSGLPMHADDLMKVVNSLRVYTSSWQVVAFEQMKSRPNEKCKNLPVGVFYSIEMAFTIYQC
jgi:hypothetical protein